MKAGVPFVTLYDGGWDHHENIFDAYNKKMPDFESSIAALIQDLEQQGMLDRTLVIALGEFGRTPKINERGGRDHWSNAMSVMFAGGGTPGGQVVGATDRQGFAAIERVLSPENFVSTIYRNLVSTRTKSFTPPKADQLISSATPTRSRNSWAKRSCTDALPSSLVCYALRSFRVSSR